MITRYALFEGHVHDGQTEAFRAAVLALGAKPEPAA